MKDVISSFLDAIASRCAHELRMATELGDKGRHADSHEHLVRYGATQDVLTLGQEMLGRELDRELKNIREGARA